MIGTQRTMNIKDYLNLKKGIYQKCMSNIRFNPATVRSNHCNGRNKAKMLILTAWLDSLRSESEQGDKAKKER